MELDLNAKTLLFGYWLTFLERFGASNDILTDETFTIRTETCIKKGNWVVFDSSTCILNQQASWTFDFHVINQVWLQTECFKVVGTLN